AALVEHALFDHSVSTAQYRWWDRQSERLRGLEVDDQFELRRLLDWEVGGLGVLQDLVDVGRGLAKLLGSIGPIRHEKARFNLFHSVCHRRETVLPCQLGGSLAARDDEGISQSENPV